MILQFMSGCRRSMVILLLVLIICRLAASDILYRINRVAKPISYNLYLRTEFESSKTGVFSGDVIIAMEMLKSTDVIELNAVDLEIKDAHLFRIEFEEFEESRKPSSASYNLNVNPLDTTSKTKIPLKGMPYLDPGKETLTIKAKVNLEPSDMCYYALKIVFTGNLGNDSNPFGYYKLIGWPIALTNFHLTEARTVFPCFDEPDMKALFRIRLSRPKSSKTNCNLRFITTVNEDADFEQDIYAEPKTKMSTRVISFAVHNHYNIRKQFSTENNKLISVWTRTLIENVDFNEAIRYARIFLDYYETYFDVDYPFEQLDILSLGILSEIKPYEAWGLMIGGVKYFTSVFDNTLPVLNFGHNLAQYWIGNMVTFDSWDDIWMQEGFATYIDHTVGAKFAPVGEMNEEIIDMELFMASLDYDESKDFRIPLVRSMTKTKGNPMTLVNSLSGKANCIIRMIAIMYGKLNFDIALRKTVKYFSKTGVVKGYKFWERFDKELVSIDAKKSNSGNLAAFIKTWAIESGYPVITVNNDVEHGIITVTEKESRYLYTNLNDNDVNVSSSWAIPLSYRTEYEDVENPLVRDWLHPKQKFVLKDTTDWIIFNVNSAGYYRVNYNTENWLNLAKTMKHPKLRRKISGTTKARLLNDVWYFAYEKKISYSVVFEMMKTLEFEKEYIVWWAALEPLEKLLPFVDSLSNPERFSKQIAEILKPIFKRIYTKYEGFTYKCSKDMSERKLIALIIKWGCWADILNCRKYTKQLYYRVRSTETCAEMKDAIFTAVIQNGSETDWLDVFNNPMEKNIEKKLPALAIAKGEKLISHYFGTLVVMDVADYPRAFDLILRNTSGYRFILNSFYNHFKEDFLPKISHMYESKVSKIEEEVYKCIEVLSKYLREKNDLTDVKEFFLKKFPSLQLDKKNENRILNNIKWVENNQLELQNFITNYKAASLIAK